MLLYLFYPSNYLFHYLCQMYLFKCNIKFFNKTAFNFKVIKLIYVLSPVKFLYTIFLVNPLVALISFCEELPQVFKLKVVYRKHQTREIIIIKFSLKKKKFFFFFFNEFFIYFLQQNKILSNLFYYSNFVINNRKEFIFGFPLALNNFLNYNTFFMSNNIYYNCNIEFIFNFDFFFIEKGLINFYKRMLISLFGNLKNYER